MNVNEADFTGLTLGLTRQGEAAIVGDLVTNVDIVSSYDISCKFSG